MKTQKKESRYNFCYAAFFVLFFCSFSAFILDQYIIPNSVSLFDESIDYKEAYCNITGYDITKRSYPYAPGCASCVYNEYLLSFDVRYITVDDGDSGNAIGYESDPMIWYTSLERLNYTLENYKIGDNVSCYLVMSTFEDVVYFEYEVLSTLLYLYFMFYTLIFLFSISLIFIIVSCIISYKVSTNKINKIDKTLYENL
ncbi:Transmembrane protein with four helix bundle sensory domain [Orpheovirus IHUMI-LCC2]|uniref:Transmembrane protein with four helix bundle sensory domain n=1 Tax=Orpheovirus IHUMI-LCC2 TaxID=2023057 RepID=A0A2I2L4W0_9VIRU|nr:Transmembrane protein with four helix bundle sensory domain [Orpheovirus IHUMI-LCC2]SNW62582.1 Transmembrane protein with four helix bundle sensory domain [Orpheovirus IHUMI-LCC2]